MNADKSVTFCEPFGLPWYFGEEAKTSRTLNPIELPEDCGEVFPFVLLVKLKNIFCALFHDFDLKKKQF